MNGTLIRTPVRITGTTSRWDRHLIGREATAYSGDPERTAVRLLSPLLHLSAEASATHRSGYVRAEEVTVEPLTLDAVTEKGLL